MRCCTASSAIFLAILQAFHGITQAESSCPTGTVYNSVIDKCYYFASRPLQFTAAEEDCASRGGHLTSIQNGFENSVVTEIGLQVMTGTNQSDFWTGGNDLSSPAAWQWIDGTTFVYNNWAIGNPSMNGDCLSVWVASGKWMSTDCHSFRPYVCSVPKNPDVTCPPPPVCPTTSSTSQIFATTQRSTATTRTIASTTSTTSQTCPSWCPSEWTYFAHTDSCYKRKWNDAEAECVSRSAHLASVHSDAENTFICNLAKASVKLANDRMTWIGLHYNTEDKRYIWTDGTETNYTNWAPKQPDSPGRENCIELYADQSEWLGESNWYEKWNDFDCNKQLRNFVCKQLAGH